MTTTTQFIPGNTSPPFQFQPTLDGTTYSAAITWLLTGQRWYITLSDKNGVVIFNLPLIASPPPPQQPINLAAGYFTTSTLIFYDQSQTFVVSP